MIAYTLARRYAKAFLGVASEEGRSKEYGEELARFTSLWEKEKEIKEFLLSPAQDRTSQKKTLQRMAEEMGFSPLTSNFIQLLLDKERLKYLSQINQLYQKLLAELNREIKGQIISALPLTQDSLKELAKRLEEISKKKVILKEEQDPSLIGGMVVKLGNTIFDGSIKTQLIRIKEQLRKE